MTGAKGGAGGSAGNAAGGAADNGPGTNPGGSAGQGTDNPGGSAGQGTANAAGTGSGASAGSAAGQQMAGTTSATPTGGTGVTPAAGAAAGTTPTAAPSGAATTPAAATPAAATPAASAATPVAAAPAGAPGGTIVPLYTPPGDPSWNTVIAGKAAHPRVNVVAVVNPANGPGGGMNSAYAVGISKLASAGVKVIGYVATGYGANAAAAVKADIDRWQNFYPGQISGIFFDEQSNKPEQVGYYRDLSQYAKSKGLSFTVGNPGTDTAESYVGALDVMLIYESAGVPSAAAMGGWHTKHPASNFGVIPYAASIDPAFVRSARQYVGYVYVQNDTLPNPWDSVPANFADLLAALE